MNIELHQITEYSIILIRRKIRAMNNFGSKIYNFTLNSNFKLCPEKGNEKQKHVETGKKIIFCKFLESLDH